MKRIQFFLIGLGLLNDRSGADGNFGQNTKNAVALFQSKNGLDNDGIVGPNTLAKMIEKGLSVENRSVPAKVTNYPVKPSGVNALSTAQRNSLFGVIRWRRSPSKSNPEGIIITNNWDDENIVTINVPQLVKAGLHKTGNMSIHKKIVKQTLSLWEDWEKNNLLKFIISYDGAFNPRLIRGSKSTLSQHAHGTAIDINAEWNGLGRMPARPGQKGCLYDLVPFMYKWGFFWGGHFSRRDGMHFEVYKVIS